ncbi:fumarylacetoacetate hydrolase family protein [Micromonospora sp. NPDC007271]|uniref:fumarylacetoacetate hydrolase family protein n=1 Tax=Micromonospora sp. NPDC007271 TaxID=3154587 RepID=UPI0033FB91CC
MRIGRVDDRAVLVKPTDDRIDAASTVQVAYLSEPFGTTTAIFADFAAFRRFLATEPELRYVPTAASRLQAPVPLPGQVFGVGLNYTDHLAEIGRAGTRPLPMTFTKFPSSITGPFDPITLPTDSVDYEVELVLVIGRHADRIAAEDAWDHVAGVTVGQDLSARGVQQAQQLSLSKSFRGFAPIGPWVVTSDELPDRDALPMTCWLNGEVVQKGTTADMVHNVAELLAFLSTVTALRPGDLVFTGTCAGVGFFRTPQLFLRPGDVVRSEIAGVGSLVNPCVAPSASGAYDQAFAALAVRPPLTS